MTNSRRWLLAGCASVMAAMAYPAFAQPAKPVTTNSEEEGAPVIEALTVTAERRAQNIEDVPLAITAFTDKVRENIGISTIQDLAQFTPGLSYNAANDRPTIRGVGRQTNNHGINSPVANYIDGVYTSSVQDTSRRPIFIDRTEIIRGPQGSLSGKGSAAGAIYTYSKRPRKTFEAEIGGFLNNYERSGIEGTITGPINDSLRYRVNGARYVQTKGFFTNAEDGHTEGARFGTRNIFDAMLEGNVGSKIDFFVKGSAVDYNESLHDGGTFAPNIAGGNACQPTAFTGGLTPGNSVGYFSSNGNPATCGTPSFNAGSNTAPNFVAFDPQAVIYGAGLKQNPVITTGNLRSYINNYNSDLHLDGYYNLTGDVTYHAPIMDIRYILGHAEYSYTQSSEGDGSAVQNFLIQPLFNGGPGRRVDGNGVNVYKEAPNWTSNELTFTSTGDHKLNWILGLYKFQQLTNQQPQTFYFSGYPELNTPLSQTTFAPVQVNALPFASQFGRQDTTQNTAAVFGQLDYKFNKQWEISGGLRYNTDKEKALESTRLISNSFNGGANGMNASFSAFAPISLDVTASVEPGFALVNPATTVLEPGYRLLDVSAMGTTGAATAACPSGTRTVVGVTGCSNFQALLGPGAELPTIDAVSGNRQRVDHGKWSALTGSIGINYTPNDDTLFYLRYAKGYRPGGFGSGTAGYLPLNPYTDKEGLDSYETGTKFTLWSKLQMNVSAFRYNYKDIQAGLTRFERCTVPGDFTTCSATPVTVNLPSAINQGIEVEGLWFATNDLQLVLSYAYLDAHIDNGKLGLGFEDTSDPAALLPTAKRLNPITCVPAVATGTNVAPAENPLCLSYGPNKGLALDSLTLQPRYTQDLSGNKLPNAPKNKVAVNANYTFHFDPGTVTASYSYIWRSEAQSDLFGSSLQVTKGYSQSNARLVFRQKDDKMSVIVFAQNLFNQDVYETGSASRRGAGFTPAQSIAAIATENARLTAIKNAAIAAGNLTATVPLAGLTNAGGASGTAVAQTTTYYQNFGLVLPRVYGIEILKKFR